ncbi:receptor-type tyrosine-protein phosphatase F-like [Acanthaster planci]|uniref:Receptor-type tyrosine-protein phosphatase F-like n=1 Tax=Acanthaster planci TaxID=133434 RepID=A0A8B8A2X2_ACAPL|nr:receptor-type tyrosine-protein phosphatase F-like [Acanthaster planci]
MSDSYSYNSDSLFGIASPTDEVNITYEVDNMEGANDRTDVVLTCIARGNPEPVMVWYDTNDTEIAKSSGCNSSKFIVTMEVSDGDEVYGYEVTSYLTIKKVDSQVDYRVYVCNSSSGIGKEDKLEIILHGTRLPDMPRKVKITNRTAESLTVVWSGVFNGGEVQSFRVSYLKTSKEVFTDQTGGRTTSTATGLDKYTEYETRVYASNIIGENNKYASIKGYTLPSPTTTPPSGNTGIIVGAVVGGVILIAIVISLATYLVRMPPEDQKGGKKTTGGAEGRRQRASGGLP